MRPFHLSLVLTHACNLACAYCCMGEHHTRAMGADMAEHAVSLALAHARATTDGRLDVGFFGGEPLLAWDTLVRTARYVRALSTARTRLQVTTNATLIDDTRANTLADLGVETTVSLDGAASSHDSARPTAGGKPSHASALRGVEALARAGIFDDVVLVVSRANVRSLRSDVRSIAALGPRAIHVNVAYESAFSDDDVATWERELVGVAQDFVATYGTPGAPRLPLFESKIAAVVNGGIGPDDGCSVGRSNVALAPSGRLYPCDRLVGADGPHEAARVIGHLDDGIVPSRTLPRGTSATECGTCAERTRCSSYCACSNVAETGTTDTPGPLQCWHEQLVARLSDDVAEALLGAKDPNFSRWIRGGPRVRYEGKKRLPQVRS